MKVTKFQHACLLIEHEGTTLLVDPGEFAHDLIAPKHLDGVIITHEHPDHFDEKLVEKILKKYPKATIAGPESIVAQFSSHPTISAAINTPFTIGNVSLRFYGGIHAPIIPTLPTPDNFGVLINDSLYYPGDSFVVPEDTKVDVLALPVSAPWLKISDALAFLVAIKPRVVFPTHDGILSADGKAVVDRLASKAAGVIGATYRRLDDSSVKL